jgi:hypothetical protein
MVNVKVVENTHLKSYKDGKINTASLEAAKKYSGARTEYLSEKKCCNNRR